MGTEGLLNEYARSIAVETNPIVDRNQRSELVLVEPWNADSVDLSNNRSFHPSCNSVVTGAPLLASRRASRWIVQISLPSRTNECLCDLSARIIRDDLSF